MNEWDEPDCGTEFLGTPHDGRVTVNDRPFDDEDADYFYERDAGGGTS